MEALVSNRRRESRGLAEWLMAYVRAYRNRSVSSSRELRLVETLSLGGRRQLLLVACGERRYLVGAGAESVETIVPIDHGTSDARLRAEEHR